MENADRIPADRVQTHEETITGTVELTSNTFEAWCLWIWRIAILVVGTMILGYVAQLEPFEVRMVVSPSGIERVEKGP